jgi:hypothetical protein
VSIQVAVSELFRRPEGDKRSLTTGGRSKEVSANLSFGLNKKSVSHKLMIGLSSRFALGKPITIVLVAIVSEKSNRLRNVA